MKIAYGDIINSVKTKLKYPFPLKICFKMNLIQNENISWLEKKELINSKYNFEIDKNYRNIFKYRPWVFSSYCFPNSPLKFHVHLCNFLSWMIFSSHFLCGKGIEQNPINFSNFVSEVKKILDSNNYEKINSQDPILTSFIELISDLNNTYNEHFIKSLKTNLKEYYEGCFQKLIYRVSMEVPSFQNYNRFSLLQSGIYIIIDFLNIFLDYKVSYSSDEYKIYNILREKITQIIMWTNDIFHLPNDIMQSDSCNFIILLMTHEKLDLRNAYEKIILMHNKEIDSLLEIEKEVLADDKLKKLSIWIENIKYLLIGNYFWLEEIESLESQFNLISKNENKYSNLL